MLQVSANSVSIISTWLAHDDSLTSIQLIDDPPAILTSSTDRLAKLWNMNTTSLGVLRQGGPKRGETWKFGLDTRAIGAKKLEDGGKIMEEVREMEALELDSSDEEDDMSSTLTMMSYDPLAGGGSLAAQREPEVVSYRKTPKRIPVNPATVGRGGRRKRK